MVSLYDKIFGRHKDLDDDYDDYDDFDEVEDYEEEEAPRLRQEARPRLNPFSSERREAAPRAGAQSRVVDMRSGSPIHSRQEVLIMEPRDLESAQRVCDDLRSGRTVICNIEHIDPKVAQRVIDFITGAAFALRGNVMPISSLIFVVTPQSTLVTDRIREKKSARQEVLDPSEYLRKAMAR